jgi:hypothetical protein
MYSSDQPAPIVAGQLKCIRHDSTPALGTIRFGLQIAEFNNPVEQLYNALLHSIEKAHNFDSSHLDTHEKLCSSAVAMLPVVVV